MLLALVIIKYMKDCKEIGKENLAVTLSERLFFYFLTIIVPVMLGILKSNTNY